MAVNCDALGCPPAVIVAAEGGASRAAFAAATAIGDLLDRARGLPDANGRALAPARRIFAISGVSGGSFGAATIRTALADSLARGQGPPPCQRPTNGWFGADPSAVRSSWRACLQALVAGDYLTPAFVGLGWRDNFSPPGFAGGSLFFADDRAALIERAWERHYDHVVKGEIPGFWAQVAQDLAPPAEPPSGLRGRFGFVAEKTVHANGWLPLLLLNATSVDSGTRIIASDLVSTRAAPLPKGGNPGNAFGRFSLYPAAFDVLEMLAPPCAQDKIVGPSCASAHDGTKDLPLARAGPDLRLSTAALLSARFPIISPAGILRAEGDDSDRRPGGRRRLFRELGPDERDGRGARAPPLRRRPDRALGAERPARRPGRPGARRRPPRTSRRPSGSRRAARARRSWARRSPAGSSGRSASSSPR